MPLPRFAYGLVRYKRHHHNLQSLAAWVNDTKSFKRKPVFPRSAGGDLNRMEHPQGYSTRPDIGLTELVGRKMPKNNCLNSSSGHFTFSTRPNGEMTALVGGKGAKSSLNVTEQIAFTAPTNMDVTENPRLREGSKELRNVLPKLSKAQMTGNLEGVKKLLTLGLSDETDVDVVQCKMSRGIEPEVPIEVSVHDPAQRGMVKQMLAKCNRIPRGERNYSETKSTAGHVNTQAGIKKTFRRALQKDKPLIIRQFRTSHGGIGNCPATQRIIPFLQYRKDTSSPKPYCQIRTKAAPKGGGRHVTIEKMIAEFEKDTNERTSTINALGFPLMHDFNQTQGIDWPTFTQHVEEMLRVVSAHNRDSHAQRSQSHTPPDGGFAVVSMKGSYTTIHQDKMSTWAVMSEGCKIWAFMPNTKDNMLARKEWNEMEKLDAFEGVFVTDLHEGDLVVIPCGWFHAVYTVSDSLMLGGHVVFPESLENNLNVATDLRIYDHIGNDGLEELGKLFRALVDGANRHVTRHSSDCTVLGYQKFLSAFDDAKMKAWDISLGNLKKARQHLDSIKRYRDRTERNKKQTGESSLGTRKPERSDDRDPTRLSKRLKGIQTSIDGN